MAGQLRLRAMSRITRGFTGRRRPDDGHRLPPGQYDTGDSWPVLNAEVTPDLDPASWTFTVEGQVEQPTTWTWDEAHALPPSRYEGAIHCVTTWSKFDMTFDGVSVDTLLAAARPLPTARFVVAYSHTGYTTNLPLADVTDGKAWVAWEVDGEPLPRDHGGPARLLVPHLYFWKSAKWVAGLRLLDHDEPGFWEVNGYHDRGDPWLEQRYQGD
jgi:DMSO/TMAO reductase YedYZ molybdopterin-dependent catalytic subunit